MGWLTPVDVACGAPQARKGVKAVRRNADGYQMFFLNTVAVAPNKFRPSSKMGDMRFAAITAVLKSQCQARAGRSVLPVDSLLASSHHLSSVASLYRCACAPGSCKALTLHLSVVAIAPYALCPMQRILSSLTDDSLPARAASSTRRTWC